MLSAEELERRALERARTERIKIVKLVGQDRYLARSRTVEPGAYYELSVSSWGRVICSCPGFAHRSICKHAAALKARLSQTGPSDFHAPGEPPTITPRFGRTSRIVEE
jgi:SWIM zinc finger